MDDGSTQNMNAGKTSHKGIEMGVTTTPLPSVNLRFSGAYSRHRFVAFNEKGLTYDGNEMNGAPRWIHNTELWYKPAFINGLRIGLEWQQIGNYYMDPQNTVKYQGHDVLHLRLGYRKKTYELWAAVMNITDNYYAYTASKSGSGYSYTPAEPININIGISYDLGGLFKKNK
jgi:outer membrane receptor protein involved in Fe transport